MNKDGGPALNYDRKAELRKMAKRLIGAVLRDGLSAPRGSNDPKVRKAIRRGLAASRVMLAERAKGGPQ